MASKTIVHLSLVTLTGLSLAGCKGESDVLSSLNNPNATLSQVGSTVWHDINCNGLQEAGEPGLGGVRVQVFNELGGFIKEAITAPNGQYLLDQLLAPATYRVSVDESTLPPGFALTTANVGADSTIDSETNPVTFQLQASPNQTIDFGYCSTATGEVGDRVWEDLDCNGIQDAGEPGIDGVIVRLTYPSGFVRSAQTQNGAYRFTGLPDGNYSVAVDSASVPPAFGIMAPCDQGADDALDSDCQPAMATVSGGALNATVDFGYCTSFSNLVGDRVWHDLDCDGIQDAGEPGLQNVVVLLKDSTGAVLTQSTTDPNGAYTLRGVPAGTYDIEVDTTTLPAGFFAAFCDVGNDDTIDNDCSPVSVTLTPGQQDFSVDFGYCDAFPNSVGDRVWHDLDCDGLQDAGEPGLMGVDLILKDDQGVVVNQTTTDGQGAYSFAGLPPGDYTVEVDTTTLPAGFFAAFCNVGNDDTIDNDCSPAAVTLVTTTNDVSLDFGYCDDFPNSVGDRVWHDLDCDGLQDPGEPGLAGVVVNARDAQAVLLSTAVTDAQGNYTLRGLPPGTHTIEVDPNTLPAGFFPAFCDVGNDDTIDNDCSPVSVTLVTTTNDATVDFGYCDSFPNSIGDRVWHDLDCDGLQDPGEPGIAGVTVNARDSQAVLLASAVTDAQGNYTLSGLPPGTHTVEVDPNTLPAGFFPAFCDVGNDDTIDNDCSPVSVTLVTTTNDATVDFGYCDSFPNSVGDRVWHDLDCDGLQDPGEPGLSGVVVNARDAQAMLVTSAVTDGQGNYTLRGLPPGDYTIEVDPNSLPAGFFPAFCDVGNDDTIDNDCSPASVTLVTTTNDATVDFGYCDAFPNSVGNFVWHDLDCDGIQDLREPGLVGVDLILKDAQNAVVATTTTGAAGDYSFAGLAPGTYTVEVDTSTLPAGFFAAPCDAGGNDALDNDCSPFTLTLVTTTNDVTVDFGFCDDFPNSVGDFVWHDLDCDGIQDLGEPGLAGVQLELKDSQGVIVSQAVTDAQGAYTFRGLQPGDYSVEVDPNSLPAGFFAAPCNVGGDDTVDNDCSPADVSLVTTTKATDVDFGYCDDFPNSVGDRVWRDLDCDGLQDPNEPGIMGVAVVARDNQGVVLQQAVTDGNGNYTLRGLPPGTYSIEVDPSTLPPGLFAAPCNVGGDDTIDNDCSPAPVTLVTTTNDTTVDFGYCDTFGNSIGDFVWNDLDCDGLQDPGEPGISGVTVFIETDLGVLIDQTVTDGQGAYMFRGLGPGTYMLEIDQTTLPPGFVHGPCMVGGDPTIDNNCIPAFVSVVSPTADLTIDFGFCSTASSGVGNLVWDDENCDGIQDPGEPGIAGGRVFVFDTNTDQLVGTARTDANGFWNVLGLNGGTYQIVVVPPQNQGYVPSPCDVGLDDTADSDCVRSFVTLPNSSTLDFTIDVGFCSGGL